MLSFCTVDTVLVVGQPTVVAIEYFASTNLDRPVAGCIRKHSEQAVCGYWHRLSKLAFSNFGFRVMGFALKCLRTDDPFWLCSVRRGACPNRFLKHPLLPIDKAYVLVVLAGQATMDEAFFAVLVSSLSSTWTGSYGIASRFASSAIKPPVFWESRRTGLFRMRRSRTALESFLAIHCSSCIYGMSTLA
jgi:hypothetical protein